MASVNRVILIGMYQERKLSTRQIAKELGVPISRVRKDLLDAGVALRTVAEAIRLRSEDLSTMRKGKRRPEFSPAHRANISRGRYAWAEKHAVGTRVTAEGYLEYTRGPHKGRLVHVVLMEGKIGRRLARHETVHHDDENRSNNSLSNLILLSRSEHSRLHRLREMVAGEHRERTADGRFR